MLLSPPSISTSRFHFHAATGRFLADASDLGDFRLGRVFDDACDVGFTLVSAKTGKGVVVSLNESKRDAEGELMYDEFIPVTASGALDIRAMFAAVRIYND